MTLGNEWEIRSLLMFLSLVVRTFDKLLEESFSERVCSDELIVRTVAQLDENSVIVINASFFKNGNLINFYQIALRTAWRFIVIEDVES
jgi:hypothetical protein